MHLKHLNPQVHIASTGMHTESSFDPQKKKKNQESDVCLVIFELLDFSVSVV